MYSSATTSFASFLLTGVVLALFVPIELSSRPEVFTHITPGVILSLFGIGSASAIVYFLIQFGIKKTSGFIASLFFYFAPLFASLTAIPFAHEKISLNLIISVVLISVGVFSATTLKQLKRRI